MNSQPLTKLQTIKAKFVAPVIKGISKSLGNDLEKSREKKILEIKKQMAENETRILKAEKAMIRRINDVQELKDSLNRRSSSNSIDGDGDFKNRSTIYIGGKGNQKRQKKKK